MPPGPAAAGVCHQWGDVLKLLCCQVAPGTAKLMPSAATGRHLLLLLLLLRPALLFAAGGTNCHTGLRDRPLLLLLLLLFLLLCVQGRLLLLLFMIRLMRLLRKVLHALISTNAMQLQLWHKARPGAGLGGLAWVLQVYTSQAAQGRAASGCRGDTQAGQVRGCC